MNAENWLTNQIDMLLVEFLVHGEAGCVAEFFCPTCEQRRQFQKVPTCAGDVVVNQP